MPIPIAWAWRWIPSWPAARLFPAAASSAPCWATTCASTAISEVEDSIIFNHVNIGRHSRIRNAIIDRHVELPERTEIGYDLEADRQRYSVTENGVVVVVREESMIEEPE